MGLLPEQFGANLVRVIKKVKRRSPDGGTQVVKQAFHVKKANPNDEYSSNKGSKEIPSMPQRGKKIVASQPILTQMAQGGGEEEVPQEEPQEQPTRMSVQYHDIAWIKKKTKSAEVEEDPISPMLRKKYDSANRSGQVMNPMNDSTPSGGVFPTDRILWGVDEPDLLNDLRLGLVRKLRVVKPMSGLMLARIEAPRGGSYSAYLWIESLRNPVLKSVWGDLVNLEDGGALSRRAESAYEVAKACGLDDVIPPTVHRFDEEGDLLSVLPDSLIEQHERMVEWVARETGDDPENVRKRLGGHATVQLVRDQLWTIESEDWFKSIFDGEDGSNESLNNIWEIMPPDRRMSFLRLAMFDAVVWNLDRCFGDIVFCDNVKHPVIAYGNELSIPCPRCIGKRYIESGAGGYSDIPTTPAAGRAILWGDVLTMLSVRGGEPEMIVCEDIGRDIAGRMRGDRPMELARSLVERGLTGLQVSGVLSRIWLMATHSKDVARDPYFAARYYAQLMEGGLPKEMGGVADFVNQTMRSVIIDDFDFAKEIKKKDDKHS